MIEREVHEQLKDEDAQVFPKEDYSDAHYEKAEESTVPPRYYTPPEKSPREVKEKSKKNESLLPVLICSILLAALIGGLAGSSLTAHRFNNRLNELTEIVNSHESSRQKAQAETDAAIEKLAADEADRADREKAIQPSEIYDTAKKQVVGIRTEITVTNYFGMTNSSAVNGSGFVITDDGYILTNYHVIEDAYAEKLDIQVILYDGTEYTAAIAGVEPQNDLAVLKIDADGISSVRFGDSNTISVGDTVYAIGNPLGELEFSMSTGHISALDRMIQTQDSESINMFQIDAAVNEGNSGGPVYNSNGEVIGIVSAKYSSSGVEGLGFAIPINDAKTISDDLITKGYVSGKAYMGVTLDHRYNSMYSQYYGMPLGAYVAEVTAGSAAEKAGIQSGDIILSVGTYRIQDYSEVKSVLRHFSAAETTEITIYRSGEELQLTITFDEAKPD